eukprot:363362-Chlamydomonas_euryale.AAC.4
MKDIACAMSPCASTVWGSAGCGAWPAAAGVLMGRARPCLGGCCPDQPYDTRVCAWMSVFDRDGGKRRRETEVGRETNQHMAAWMRPCNRGRQQGPTHSPRAARRSHACDTGGLPTKHTLNCL